MQAAALPPPAMPQLIELIVVHILVIGMTLGVIARRMPPSNE
jgi:hypothetical protein